ncbi:hypothetical protein JNN96_32690 [Mycobacterium sp. DSM 3803]|nr:hypothetical protein [Mycobacterium sp. DSM 3803]
MTDTADNAAAATIPAAQVAADAPDSAGEPIAPDTPGTSVSDTQEGADSGNDRGKDREAAKYRKQLRATEAERDELGGQLAAMGERLAAMQRGEAERLAAEHLADGADLWRDGTDLTALLDEAGNVDPEKVRQAAQAARKAHPHWGRRVIKRNPAGRGGFHSGASGGDHHRPASWASVLNTTSGDR